LWFNELCFTTKALKVFHEGHKGLFKQFAGGCKRQKTKEGRALRNSPVGYFSEGARKSGRRKEKDKRKKTIVVLNIIS
jgi:hypothetical protein